jgi:predicted membrane protein (TIGR00267 family)
MSAIRYITRGFIDGSLSTLGIVLGAAVGGDPKVIIAAGLGGGMANAISNLLGALTAEKAGVMQELGEYEKAMVGSKVKLKDTHIYEKRKKRIWKAGLYDGLATFVGSVVPVIPFAILSISNAAIASIVVTVSLLFMLGVYLGRLSKENLIFAGIKMAIFGLITAGLAMSLEFFFT